MFLRLILFQEWISSIDVAVEKHGDGEQFIFAKEKKKDKKCPLWCNGKTADFSEWKA